MRHELAYNEGFWWHRIDTDFYCRNATLGEWDSPDNYEQVTDEQYEAATSPEIEPEEALNIITGGTEL